MKTDTDNTECNKMATTLKRNYLVALPGLAFLWPTCDVVQRLRGPTIIINNIHCLHTQCSQK